MNSNFGLSNKKTNKTNINKPSISKSTLNPKKISKKKEEAKSTNIEMFQKNTDVNKIIPHNINNDGEIKLQEKQKRDHSKKAKKSFVNKNIKKNNIDNSGANTITNLNKSYSFILDLRKFLDFEISGFID